MLDGVLAAARLAKKDMVIELDSAGSTLSLPLFARIATDLAQSHPQSIGLMVSVEATAAAAEPVISCSLPSVRTVSAPKVTDAEQVEFAGWLHNALRPVGSELALSLSNWKTGSELRKLAEITGAHLLVMPPAREGRHTLVPSSLREASNLAGIPLVSSDEHLPTTQLRRLKEAGISGLLLSQVLAKAYTAGVRAGLHDRHVFLPTAYQSKGALAVKHTVLHYLQAL
jgi:hypothetical protein